MCPIVWISVLSLTGSVLCNENFSGNVSETNSFKNNGVIENSKEDVHNFTLFPGLDAVVNKSDVNVKLKLSTINDIINYGEGRKKSGGGGGGGGGKKKKGMMQKLMPMFFMPFVMQAVMMPMAIAMVKFMLMKSMMIGIISWILVGLNMLRRNNSQREKIMHEHYGYSGGGMQEAGAWVN